MIPIGQPYRLEARLDARSVLVATILGVVTALIVAAGVAVWEASRVPTLLIITPLIQGAAIGGVLAFLVGRLRLHHPRLLWTLGLLCGLTSVGMVHYVRYVRFLDAVAHQFREFAAARDDLDPARKEELLAGLANGTFNPGREFVADATGHSGWLGYQIWQSRLGVGLRRHQVKGAGVWTLWGFEALVAALTPASLTRDRTVNLLCGDCGEWLVRRRAPVALLSESAPALADAILDDDPDAIADLLATPVDPEENRRDATRVGLLACPHCGQTFADVDGYLIDHDGATTQTATIEFLRRFAFPTRSLSSCSTHPRPARGRPSLWTTTRSTRRWNREATPSLDSIRELRR